MFSNHKFKNKILFLLLILLLCINSFAAVVSDNDGAAFITKAEFDSLKNSFQSQLDDYNSGLDNKIDGAISSYLSGVRVSKTTTINPIVSNYADIMWQPNYKVYGQWIKWTNNTSRTQSSSNQWFTPSLAEKRWLWRGQSWYLYDNLEQAFGSIGTFFYIDAVEMSNGLSVGGGGAGLAGYSQYCPTLTIMLYEDKTNNIWYVPNSDEALMNIYCATQDTYSNPHKISSRDSGDLWVYNFQNDSAELTSTPSILTPSSGEYFKYQFTIKNNGGNTATFTSAMNKNNTTFPWVWRRASAFAGPNMSDFGTQATGTTSTNLLKSDYFSTGCTFHKLDNSSTIKQYTLLHNMMLGSNYDQDVNIAKYTGGRSEGTSFDMSESTEYATFKGTYTRTVVSSLGYVDTDSSGWKSYTGNVIAAVPHWPKYSIRQLTSNKFKNGTTPLKIGQGLPIYLNSLGTGDLQISFDYDIKYLLNTTSYKTSRYLYIDLKTADYLDKSTVASNFYDAYDDIVQSSKTTLTKHKYQNYRYPNKTGTIKLTAPIKEGQSLWLRIRPETETGGYYAQIKNLKVTLVTE